MRIPQFLPEDIISTKKKLYKHCKKYLIFLKIIIAIMIAKTNSTAMKT